MYLLTLRHASCHLHFSKRMAEASQLNVESQSEEMIAKEVSSCLVEMERKSMVHLRRGTPQALLEWTQHQRNF
jgi:hypothetical protein